MNLVFVILFGLGVLSLTLSDPQAVLPTLLSGTKQGVDTSLKLTSVYALWVGLMEVLEQSGVQDKLSKLFGKVFGRLFKGESPRTHALIGLNLAANFLGLGGAATPVGIDAMASMTGEKNAVSDNMILFFVLNITAVQLVPTTVVSMRAAEGSMSAGDVILPTLVCSVASALFGVGLCLACRAVSRKLRARRA